MNDFIDSFGKTNANRRQNVIKSQSEPSFKFESHSPRHA